MKHAVIEEVLVGPTCVFAEAISEEVRGFTVFQVREGLTFPLGIVESCHRLPDMGVDWHHVRPAQSKEGNTVCQLGPNGFDRYQLTLDFLVGLF